jgi:hypothetical protein
MQLASTITTHLADASSAASVMHSFVAPVIQTLCVVASLVCVFFLVNGGYHYMTSSGKPDKLEEAKHTLKNALLGLAIVLAAATLTAILTHAYSGSSAALGQKLPNLTVIQPTPVSNGLVGILIKAVTGLLNNIIQSIAAPFLNALSFFTSHTPLMADNSSVFNLWLAIAGMCDVLFVLVIALLGFHVMSASSFGFDEIEVKHLLPRLALIFLLVNTSIFAIDGIIELSNVMIRAVNDTGASSVWDTLTNVVKQSGSLGVGSLLIMIAFLIFSVILLIYYVGRIVTLYLGAVLSPIVLLLWLIPGFRDFAETAFKTYVVTIFVLFVNVIILELAASLFAGIHSGGAIIPSANDLMSLIVGLAAVIALLKTQGVMMQFSYASIGPRSARKLGGQFMNGVTYIAGKGKSVFAANTDSKNGDTDDQKKGSGQGGSTHNAKRPLPTGTTYAAPRTRDTVAGKSSGQKTNTAAMGSTETGVKRTKKPGSLSGSSQTNETGKPFDPTRTNNKRRSNV